MIAFKHRLILAALFLFFLIGGNAEAAPVHCTPETPGAIVHANGVIVCPVK